MIFSKPVSPPALLPVPLRERMVSKMKLEVLVRYPISARLLILIMSVVSAGSFSWM